MRVSNTQPCTSAIHGGHPLMRAYPTTRPTFPQSHACYDNYMARDVCHSVPSPLSCESRWRRWYMRTAHVCGPSQIRLRARCFRNPTHVMNCSYGVQLIAAVAAYSWLQLRRAVVGCSCGLLGLFRGSAGSVRSVSKLVPSVRGLRAAIHGLHHYTILAVICRACSRKVSVSTPRS